MAGYPTYNWGTSAEKREVYAPTPRVITNPAYRQQKRQQDAQSSALSVALKAVAVVCVMFLVIGIIRVSISSASVATAMEVEQLAESIDAARVDGKSLEVSQSALSNPTRIKSEAAAMGMVAADSTYVIDISDDVVVLDADGNLSLTESLSAALGQ